MAVANVARPMSLDLALLQLVRVDAAYPSSTFPMDAVPTRYTLQMRQWS